VLAVVTLPVLEGAKMNKKIYPQPLERGQSMVELALTITILMILLAGVIDMGRAFFTYMAMRDAAQEGAAYGSLNPFDVAGIRSRVYDNLDQVVPDPEHIEEIMFIGIIYGGPMCLGNEILVKVDYPQFPLTMPFLGWILNSQTLAIHATINDTILRPTCGE
jgi:hypothetical protein